jgi:hypothetical protein
MKDGSQESGMPATTGVLNDNRLCDAILALHQTSNLLMAWRKQPGGITREQYRRARETIAGAMEWLAMEQSAADDG